MCHGTSTSSRQAARVSAVFVWSGQLKVTSTEQVRVTVSGHEREEELLDASTSLKSRGSAAHSGTFSDSK